MSDDPGCLPVWATHRIEGRVVGEGEVPGLHDWRLWSRIWDGEGFLEQWYCTKCRYIEVRSVYE